MIIKDSDGNALIRILDVEEKAALKQYSPVTHCLAVVMIDDDYLLGWNRWRSKWEIFGGCREKGESMRECITRECLEEIGISDVSFEYIGLMEFNLVPDYFSPEERKEYGGLYGIRLCNVDLQMIERYRIDREEIDKIELLQEIGQGESIAEIDRELLKYFK